ncbi:M-phase phosphoprotein 6 [Diachasma alloeum]|uniref:M-phase phosphoprotein 6 n=1 Tax=Diachasma alloeum TaxID=454923 RepID=UPI0007381BE1|nr:M-phase phosphoprotein 6 [Diachasma alloeum]
MAEREMGKMKLSKSILEMKFMKRTKEKVEQQLFQTEGEEYFESQLTTRLKKESGKYLIEPSFMYCEKLIEGRLSFQGMNPEVEQLIEAEYNEKRQKQEKLKEEEISETQMANHYKSCNPRMNNKNRNRKKQFFSDENRERQKFKRTKFMKPSD